MEGGSSTSCSSTVGGSLAAEALQEVEERLSCAVCQGNLTQPKFLPCHHAFCQGCLSHVSHQRGPGGSYSLKCPVCCKPARLPEEGISGFPNAFHTSDLAEAVSCENCEKREANGFCQQCQHFLCQKCIDAHCQLVKLFSGHEIIDISEVTATDSQIPPMKHRSLECPKHDKNLCIYCHKCDILICGDCTIRDHREHDYDPISDKSVYAKYREEIESNLQETRQRLAFVMHAVETFNQCIIEIKENRDRVKEEIRATGDQMISEYTAEVQQSVTRLEKKVDTGAEKKLRFMSSLITDVQTTAGMLQSCVRYVEGKLRMNSQQQILASKKEMVETMEMMASQVKEENYSLAEKPNIKMHRRTGKSTTIGEIEFSTLMDNCEVSGEGIVETHAGQRTRFTLNITPTPDSEPLLLPTSLISCQLSSSEATRPTNCGVMETSSGEYEVSYTPVSSGPHQLRVRVAEIDIPGSPFTVHVKTRATCTPLRTIEGLNGPWDVSVGMDGIVVVTEYHGHCVTLVDKEGGSRKSFGSGGTSPGEFNYPGGVVVTYDDKIIVSDGFNHRIQKFSMEGRYLQAVGSRGNGQRQFHYPDGVNVDNSNRIFVVDCENSRVQVLHSDMTYSHTIGVQGSQSGQFCKPCSIAIDSEGMVYVTDFGNHRVQKFTPEGVFVAQFGKKGIGEGEIRNPLGITIDNASNTVYVSSNHKVSAFTTNGQFLREFGKRGSGEGEFSTPIGLAVDESTGDLFVCDFDNGRVVVY